MFHFGTGLSQEDEDISDNRFAVISDKDITEMMKKKSAKNTVKSTHTAVNILTTYCQQTGIEENLNDMTATNLNSLLCKFYISARTEKGELYKINSMRSIRSGLQRHFLEQVFSYDILSHHEFKEANICFENMLKNIKTAGKGETEHYPEIEPEDLKKLYASFDTESPVGLFEKVWFDIMFQLVRRGRENLRSMTKNSFSIDTDATGRRYVFQTRSELDKNHNINDDTFDTTGEGRIYETGSKSCPVLCFEKYLNSLHPNLEALWQRPREKSDSSIWYCNVAVGQKFLGNLMANMSTKYGLSQRYTNHSIRVTSLQVLEDENIEGRHIIRVSGHKNVDSVKNYARRLSTARKRNISSILSNSVSTTKKPKISNETVESSSQMVPSVDQFSDSFNDIAISDDALSNIPNNILAGNATNNAPSFFQSIFSNQQLGNFTPFIHNCNVSFNINVSK